MKTVALTPTWLAGASVRVAVTITLSRIGPTLSSRRSGSAAHDASAGSKPASEATMRQAGGGDGQLEAAAIVREDARVVTARVGDPNERAWHRTAVLVHDRAGRGTGLSRGGHGREHEQQEDENARAGGAGPPRAEESHRCSFRRLTRRYRTPPCGEVS